MGTNMAEVEFPKTPRLPRILERRPAPADFQLAAPHRERSNDIEAPDGVANEIDMRGYRGGDASADAAAGARKLQQRLPKPLDEIATLVRGLIYGEMIELSEALWKNHPEGAVVTQDNLPALLHRWSTSHLAAVMRLSEKNSQ
jgi:hypothetical protein